MASLRAPCCRNSYGSTPFSPLPQVVIAGGLKSQVPGSAVTEFQYQGTEFQSLGTDTNSAKSWFLWTVVSADASCIVTNQVSFALKKQSSFGATTAEH